METNRQNRAHSADYFGEARDFWWNRDFLELMAKRLGLSRVHTVLDAGCGIGHWGRALAWVLPDDAEVVGVDREKTWVEQAATRASQMGTGNRFRFQVGDINHLPFPDSSFDMVTCQTVLIHVPDPETAVREMLRVVKPGGLLLAVEPSNLANEVVGSSVSAEAPLDEVVALYRFAVICQRGKRALNLGFLSIGDLLPGLFARIGVDDIRVYLSDKAAPLFPPYAGAEQQAYILELTDWAERGIYIGNKSETRRYFLAGGGPESEFESLWNLFLEDSRKVLNSVADQTYHTGGARVHYLVSGRRKEALHR